MHDTFRSCSPVPQFPLCSLATEVQLPILSTYPDKHRGMPQLNCLSTYLHQSQWPGCWLSLPTVQSTGECDGFYLRTVTWATSYSFFDAVSIVVNQTCAITTFESNCAHTRFVWLLEPDTGRKNDIRFLLLQLLLVVKNWWNQYGLWTRSSNWTFNLTLADLRRQAVNDDGVWLTRCRMTKWSLKHNGLNALQSH